MKKTVFFFCNFLALIPLLLFAQQRFPLHEVANQSGEYIEQQLSRGTRVILYPLVAPFGEMSAYIAGETSAKLANSRQLTILEHGREITTAIEQETAYQHSGEVSDETMISIGKKLGAEYLTSFGVQNMGGLYVFTLKLTALETGELKGQKNFILEPDALLLNLASKPDTAIPHREFDINDSKKIFIFGYEIIETSNKKLLNQTSTSGGELRKICLDNHLRETRFTLPDLFPNVDAINLDDVIDYIISNKNMFPIQYVLLYLSKTTIASGSSRYNIPDRISASYKFVLIDFYSGQITYSDTVDTNGYLFELPNLNETTIINESIKALKYLFAKNKSININDILNH